MNTSSLSAASAAIALTALTAALVATPSAASGPHPATPARSPAAGEDHRAPSSGWVRISDTPVSVLSRPGLHRTSDGVLHVAYVADESGGEALLHAAVSADRSVTARHRLVAGWVGLEDDVEVVPRPDGGLRVLFAGQQTTTAGTGNIFDSGRLHNVVSDPARTSWGLPAESIGRHGGAGWGGPAGLMLPDGRPFGLRTSYKGLAWYAGTTTDPAPEPADPAYQPSATVADASVAAVGDRVFASWHALGSTEESTGVHVMQVHPAPGPDLKAPGSGSTAMATSDAALATSSTGHLYAAYPVGSPSITGYRLWNVSTGRPLPLADRDGYGPVALDAGPGGRMWLAWKSGYAEVSVVRTNGAGSRFSAPQTFEVPGGTPVHQLAVSSGGGYADVVVNSGGALLLHRFVPGLEVTASPRRLRAGQSRSVSFRVTDAGEAVRRAVVRVAGERCRTSASGRCSIRLTPRRPGRLAVRAARTGYGPAVERLVVRR